MTTRTWLSFLLLVAAGLGGCLVEVLEPDVGELRAGVCNPEDSDPDYDVSFREDLLPIFERSFGQAGCSCHLPTSRRPTGIEVSGLDLSTYAKTRQGGNTSGKSKIVVPGDPCSSVLLQKVSSAPPFGARMPSDGPPYLTPVERQLLSDWIFEGARDN